MKKYSKEFKATAVQRALTEDRSIAEIARELKIEPHRLYEWRSAYLLSSEGEAPAGETPEQELVRLRAELKRVRQEREILKKAVTFFAQNPE
jgi:transposase